MNDGNTGRQAGRVGRLGAWLLVIMLYYLVAAASLDGVYGKYGLNDTDRWGHDFAQMTDGTARKPYVYRQLVPETVNLIDSSLPQAIRLKANRWLTPQNKDRAWETYNGMLVGVGNDARYAIRYYLTYMICFTSLFVGMGLIYAFCAKLGFSRAARVFAPVAFVTVFPLLENIGAYYYDFTEIVFLFAFLNIFLYRRFLILAVPLAILGVENKESFLFFMLCAAPLVIRDRRDMAAAATLAVCVLSGAVVHILDVVRFKTNPGGAIEFHLFDNMKYYLNPLSLLSTEKVYRMPTYGAYSLVTLLAIAAMVRVARGAFDLQLKRYIALTVGVNLVLVVLFASPGEMRNFSISYPVLILLVAVTIDRSLLGVNMPKRSIAGQSVMTKVGTGFVL